MDTTSLQQLWTICQQILVAHTLLQSQVMSNKSRKMNPKKSPLAYKLWRHILFYNHDLSFRKKPIYSVDSFRSTPIHIDIQPSLNGRLHRFHALIKPKAVRLFGIKAVSIHENTATNMVKKRRPISRAQAAEPHEYTK